MNQQQETIQKQQVDINHANWLRQDITGYHLNKLEEVRLKHLDEASNAAINFSLENREEIILSKLTRARTISDIINYVKTNQYPS